MIEKLGEHYKLVYEIIKENAGIASGDLFEAYQKACKKEGLEPKSQRTLNNYLDELIALGYVKSERVGMRGNVRKFSVV